MPTKKNVHQVVHEGRQNLLQAQTSAVRKVRGEIAQVKREVDGLSRKLGRLLEKL